MKVFRVADGTSWTARLHDGSGTGAGEPRAGWEAIVFEASPALIAQRLVYRPVGWLDEATTAELAEALEEGVTVRLRWGN